MSRRGLTAEYDPVHEKVSLFFGESVVYEWPVAEGDLPSRAQWRVDLFVAKQLRRIIDAAEQVEERAP